MVDATKKCLKARLYCFYERQMLISSGLGVPDVSRSAVVLFQTFFELISEDLQLLFTVWVRSLALW
jgi:hypothetical protein